MKTLAVILTLLAAGLGAAAAARPASTAGTLQATVGPGYTITLTQDGARVTRLDPGTYTIDVSDQSSIHDFHLTGPGVDESTDVEGTGTTTWTVTFQVGTYTFLCDAHPTTMRGTFTVGSAAPSAPAPLAVRILSARLANPRTVRVAISANRPAAFAATLWKGHVRLATAHATGKAPTLRLVARKALEKGRYLVKVTGGSAVATKAVVVR
jgi:plastocyanin